MFTGIVEEIGCISAITPSGDGIRIEIEAAGIASKVKAGESVAINGVCLTAVADGASGKIKFDAVKETQGRSTVLKWRPGQSVNLEQALTLQSRMGGHIVQGHIDGLATLNRVQENTAGKELHFQASPEYLRYIVPKGSITIDGISLTIAGCSGDVFRIAVIPHTVESTTIKTIQPGDTVNVETDILGRYVEQLLTVGKGVSGLTAEQIFASGFGNRTV